MAKSDRLLGKREEGLRLVEEAVKTGLAAAPDTQAELEALYNEVKGKR